MIHTRFLFVLLFVFVSDVTLSAVQAAETKAPDLTLGKESFARVCGQCHGADALGGEGPPLIPLPFEESLIMVLVRSGQGRMPALPDELIKDDEVAAVLAYLATLNVNR